MTGDARLKEIRNVLRDKLNLSGLPLRETRSFDCFLIFYVIFGPVDGERLMRRLGSKH